MPNEHIKALALFRIEQAYECLHSAEMDLQVGHLRSAANRSYYCIFHTMRGVLALTGYDSKKHSGIISKFRELYIKTGVFSTAFSTAIGSAFEIRNNSDYQDFYVVLKADVVEQIDNAKRLIAVATQYIHSELDGLGGGSNHEA